MPMMVATGAAVYKDNPKRGPVTSGAATSALANSIG